MARPERLWRLVNRIFGVCSSYFSESIYLGESVKNFWAKIMVGFLISAAKHRQRCRSGPLSKNMSKNSWFLLIMLENGRNKNFHLPFFFIPKSFFRHLGTPRWDKNHFRTLWSTPEAIIWKTIFDFSWEFQCWSGDQFHCWPMARPGRLRRLVNRIFGVCSVYFSESI